MGKVGLEQIFPISHNLKTMLTRAIRDSSGSGELGKWEGDSFGGGGQSLVQVLILLNGPEITPACAEAKLRPSSFPAKIRILPLLFWLLLPKKKKK